MLPSQLRLGSNFVVRTLIISAIIASLFAAGCGTSYTAQPTPPQAPTITQQPTSQTVAPNGTATFTASANGNPAPTVQWQVSTDSGATFGNVSGATSTTLTLSPVTVALNGYQYRAVFTNSVTSVNSNAATLTVSGAPAITTNPSSQTVNAGSTVSFTAAASGVPAPTVQWQVSTDGGATFTDVTAATSTAYTFTASAGQNGNQYQAVFTNSAGIAITTQGTLTVDFAPTITQPPLSLTVPAGGTATFTASASGNPTPTVQWQVSTDNGATFTNVASATSTTLTVSGVTLAQSGNQYQAVFTNSVMSATTAAATLTVVPGPPVVSITGPPSPLFAGGSVVNIAISVSNDSAPDTVTATLTADSNTGLACSTPAICGTLGSVTGTQGSGGYLVSYTPPTSLSAQVVPTLFVTSSLSGSFAATDYIEVDPAGRLVVLSGLGGGGIVQAGSTQKTVTATVYNDVAGGGVTFNPPLTASGFACPIISATNICGSLGAPSAPSGTSTTTTTIPYTPPASVPAPPYDKPRIEAISFIDSTTFGSNTFVLSNTTPTNTGLRIPIGNKFNSALASPSAAAITVNANIANDTGLSRSVKWTLTANGSDCQSICGTLGTQVLTGNGTSVSSAITYMPPTTVPTLAADLTPTITATSVDNPTATDSFTFTISDGTCGTGGQASVLNGQYAFLLQGGSANAGYTTLIGSFTANGAGGITGGLLDANASTGPSTGITILPSGSSYTVGLDNRVCLTLANSAGGVQKFRAGVGILVAGVATRGRIIRFDDNNARLPRQSGILMKQDPTSFNPGALLGTYVNGFVGVDFYGFRNATVGVLTSNGTGALTSVTQDYDVAGPTANVAGNTTGGSGSYIMAVNAASGRGTATIMTSGLGTNNLVLYMVSSSEILAMTTDNINIPNAVLSIYSGELRKQTGPFPTTTLDGNNYVLYLTGVDHSSGGNDTVIGQATFTTNGNATVTIDENNNGTLKPTVSGSVNFPITSNGRATIPGLGTGSHPSILYLIDANSAFVVGTDNAVAFGYVEKQIGSAFATSSISGSFFLGGDAPTTGVSYKSGTASFNSPASGTSSISGKSDDSGPNGLKTDILSPATGWTYSFSGSSNPTGKGTVGPNSIAYAISVTKIVFMSTSANPEIFVGQR